jgi:two-component system, cell cycle sensor histidine kinase and response regulator CckA
MNLNPPRFEPDGDDSTERRRDDQALRDERFRLLVQSVTDYAIFMLDPDGRIVCWNTGAEKVFGYGESEVIRQHHSLFFTPEDILKGTPDLELRTALERGRFEAECQRIRKDGTRFLANVVIAPVRQGEPPHLLGFSSVTRDVTETRRLEEQLRNAQKMEAVGSLAAGVAHDFNNLLTVINGYTDVLLATLHEHDSSRASVEQIGKAGEHAARLTRQLLAVGRKQMLQPVVLDLNTLLTDVESLLRKLAGEGVDFTLALSENLRRIEADPGQVEQVVINLAVNACDAMPRGGQLTIRTANADLDGSVHAGEDVVRPGPYVRLTVADTGHGMDARTLARAFEPFFTTKGPGKGTGLGLSTVFGIVKQSGGHIQVSSELGSGATFDVYLPGVEGPVREEKAHPYSSEVAGGSETLLLVEDEEGVRGLGQYLLQKGGYNVLLASHGEEAMEVAAHYQGRIHLLVTDVVMSGLSGLQVANRLKPLRPDMRVLYLSGYSEEAVTRQGVFSSRVPFLQKPFTPKDLAAKVREVLDGTWVADSDHPSDTSQAGFFRGEPGAAV